MENTKILVLLNGFWNAMSGGDRHLLECGQHLTEQGIDIDFMIPDDAEFEDYPKSLKCISYADPSIIGKGKDCKGFLSISYLYWKRNKAIIKYMKEHKGDMMKYTHVIISGPFLYDINPGVYLKNMNPDIKTILYYHHTTKPSKGLRYKLAKIQEWNALRLTKKYIDLIITSNIIEQEKLERLTGKPVRLTSHGIDWEIIRKSKYISRIPLSVCFIGRLEKSKGVYDLLNVWREIIFNSSKNYTNSQLYIIGQGIEEDSLKQTVKDMNIEDNVTFCGHVTDNEKYQFLLGSQLFLFPSKQEGFGVCLIEAMGCGCETIAYNLEHYKSLFGDYIKTVPIGDWKEMTRWVVKSFNSPLTNEKINDQVKWCKKQFNWEQVAKDNYNLWMNASEAAAERAKEPSYE